MGDIKAITTYYDGYPFRSRLEARWAVFFNEMDIEYEYEPEGFILSDGTYYLPDFYLPGFHVFFEVKAKHLLGTKEGDEAIRKISDGMSTDSWAGLITFGDPMDNNLYIYCQETDEDGGGTYESDCIFGNHPDTGKICLFVDDTKDRSFFVSFRKEGELEYIPMYTAADALRFRFGRYYTKEDFQYFIFKHAAEKARQARFEHGETPKGRTTK